MHKILIFLPVILAACMAAEPRYFNGYEVTPVMEAPGWAGCEAEGGSFATGDDGRLVCVSG